MRTTVLLRFAAASLLLVAPACARRNALTGETERPPVDVGPGPGSRHTGERDPGPQDPSSVPGVKPARPEAPPPIRFGR